MRAILRTLTMTALAGLAACHTPNIDAVEENAIVAEGDTRDAADQRADDLDRLANDLDDRAPTAGGTGGAMRNEAADDRAEANMVRASGDAAAERIENAAEKTAGTASR